MYTESGIPVRHFFNSPSHYKNDLRTSLVVQRLIHLPVQGAWVQPLVQEDPTCFGVMKPVGHYYWAQALESMLCSKRSPCSAHTLRLERAHMHQWRPSPVKYMNEGTNEILKMIWGHCLGTFVSIYIYFKKVLNFEWMRKGPEWRSRGDNRQEWPNRSLVGSSFLSLPLGSSCK